MFKNNKYTNVYYRIVNRGKARNWTKKNAGVYTEVHHIIPKSKYFGGSNTNDNLVRLTAKEHYICHLLLIKMCKTNQQHYAMVGALSRLMYGRNKEHHFISASKYEFLKDQLSKRKISDEHREKLR